jgi:hypothetical protein
VRLPDQEHTSRPWRIHELTRDFRVEDVWALPAAGGRDDFRRLVAQLAAADPARGSSRATRALGMIRRRIGGMLGWDDLDAGLRPRVRMLRERLPGDLRSAPGPGFAALPFTAIYLLGDEFAAEIANRTVHAIMHLGWVPDDSEGYRGQLAVLVKPDGVLGAGYMAAIRPFRNLIVYPRMMRDLGKRWRAGAAGPAARARQIAVPPAARALSTLSRIDYEDAFFVSTGPGWDGPAEHWARAVLEGAPLRVRARLLRGWCLLGLRLGWPGSRRRVLGWRIRRAAPDFVLLSAGSRLGMPGELLFRRERSGLLFATFVQQRNSLARAIWGRAEPAHRQVVASLLTQAARREAAS